MHLLFYPISSVSNNLETLGLWCELLTSQLYPDNSRGARQFEHPDDPPLEPPPPSEPPPLLGAIVERSARKTRIKVVLLSVRREFF